MESSVEEDRQAIRQEVRELCKDFPSTYWRDIDKHEKYPQDFVNPLTASEYLAALIPEEYGGAGLGITEAGIILEESASYRLARLLHLEHAGLSLKPIPEPR